ncbi:hypothetical protein BFJ63_vAg16673 [Fusarium oxysporum f. sp. narcissi]|uniref:Transcription factor domain-containing protein n=1 Tax=Fusarium oxysporum f. sp. narcissi TaxID=451672 RepID=A0A4Q2V8Z9_FUSOX|nr:hypothetical protein BFJ63_vAg16673 [Fusarium oxysporum f. sp. narcissi]
MEADDIDLQDSATQPPSRDEHPWLAERTPKRLDAEQAHQPLDPAFVLSFRHAISSEAAKDTVYLDDTTEALMTAHSSNMDVFYPLTLTPALPQLPPEITSEQLLKAFRTNVHPHMPLICQIPIETFDKTQLSGYLSYAMAALGALTLPSAFSITLTLWSAARTLITACLEVDNREARKPSLINAASSYTINRIE